MTKTVLFCDVCHREQYLGRRCKRCGVEMCASCWDTHGQAYSSNVYFSDGGAGFYCNLCDQKLRLAGSDPLHTAYLKVRKLRAESDQWHKDFTARVAAAEKNVALILAGRNSLDRANPENITVVRRRQAVSTASRRLDGAFPLSWRR